MTTEIIIEMFSPSTLGGDASSPEVFVVLLLGEIFVHRDAGICSEVETDRTRRGEQIHR